MPTPATDITSRDGNWNLGSRGIGTRKSGLPQHLAVSEFSAMSFAEIRDEVAKLSRAERLDLAAYLVVLSQHDDPEYLAGLDRRMERMDRSDVVTAEELQAVHQRLIAEGR